MQIADLINLEAQISDDAEVPYESLLRRDRELLPIAEAKALERPALLREWIRALGRASSAPTMGSHVVRGYRLASLSLVLGGLLVGAGTASLVLRYDGTHPINVLYFAFVFLVLQVLFSMSALLLLILRGASAGKLSRLPLVADILGAVRLLNQWFARRLAGVRPAALDSERAVRWRSAWLRLRRQSKPYQAAEFWWLFGQAHWFGLAFNAAAIGTLLYRVSISDLAFAWGTTLDLSTNQFAGWVQLLGMPWGSLWPDAVPTEAVVEATRYSRLTGSYVQSKREVTDLGLVGGWWEFLLCATATYGLLPRLLLLISSRLWLGHTLRGLALNTPDIDRIVARLLAPLVETRGEVASPAATHEQLTAADSYAGRGVRQVHFLFWRDAPLAALERVSTHFSSRYQWSAAGHEALKPGRVARGERCGDASTALVVVAEAWEAPDKGFRRTLNELRAQVGAQRSIYIALLGGDGPVLQTWLLSLQTLSDPYLAVEQIA